MNELKEILKKEIPKFREIGHEFLDNKLSVMEFKGKSGGMGVYAQRGGKKFMIRLRIQSGVLSLENFKLAYEYAKKYKLKTLHFTTRQTIQLHDLEFDDVCDIMESAMGNDIFTRGGGGNYPRNVALSPLSGVACDEYFDPTPYALLVDNHFMSKITKYHLPRKLKVAFSNNEDDTANATINDLGFIAVEKDNKPYFRMYLAGGLGNNPAKAVVYPELIDPKSVLYHVEAMTELFKAEGNYENKAKARSRYIVARMGEEEFLKCYNKHYKEIIDKVKLEELPNPKVNDIKECKENDNKIIIKQRQDGLYTVVIHPLAGHIYLNDVENLIKYLSNCENIQLRISMEESLYVRNLSKDKAEELINICKNYNETTNISKSNCCVGVPTCQMGIAESQKALREIIDFLKGKNMLSERLPKLHISGCNNSCARHQVSELGLAGRKKKIGDTIKDAYEIYADGNFSMNETKLGKSYGTVSSEDLPNFLYDLACALEQKNICFDKYLHEYNEGFNILIEKYKI